MSKRTKIEGWRKIAAATWGRPRDPQIYGDMEFDATALLAFIADARKNTDARPTVTHVVGKALAHALAANPDLNVRIHGGNFVRRETIDIFFIVSAEEGAELSGVKIEMADSKSVVEIATELSARAARIRSGDDVELGRTKKLFAALPRRALSLAFRAGARITTDWNLHLPEQGLPRQPFGSAIVSSVGMFGIQHAYAPLSPYYRIPLLVLVGEATERAVVVDGQVVARPILTMSATLDHRYLDGFHAARLARSAREYMEDPKRFEPES